MKRTLLTIALFVCLASTAAATPTIVVGNYDLLPNTANQTISIGITGSDSISGMTFDLVINGGGASGGTVQNAPKITALDITGAGTMFGANFTSVNSAGNGAAQWAERSTTTSAG